MEGVNYTNFSAGNAALNNYYVKAISKQLAEPLLPKATPLVPKGPRSIAYHPEIKRNIVLV